MVTKHRISLLSRYFASECTEEEKRKVEQWVDASEKNREAFGKLKAVWELSGAKSWRWNSKRAIIALRLKLKESESFMGRHNGHSFRLYRIIRDRRSAMVHYINVMARVAAALLVLVGTFYAAYYIRKLALEVNTQKPKSPAPAFEEISTKSGQQATLKFADGTKVILNSDSKLRYRNNLIGDREFYLDGEAYFDVAHSESRHLIVQTARAVIRDIGTKFDVKSWDDDEQTKVVVADGEVFIHTNRMISRVQDLRSRANSPEKFSQIFAQRNVLVSRGQYSVVKEDGTVIPPSYTNIKRNIAWLDGKLVFYNEPMSSVMKRLRRKYGLECFAADSSILSRTVTATLDDRLTPQQVLNIIALSLNVTYRTSKDSVLFVPSKPLLEWQNKSKPQRGKED